MGLDEGAIECLQRGDDDIGLANAMRAQLKAGHAGKGQVGGSTFKPGGSGSHRVDVQSQSGHLAFVQKR